MSRLTRNDHMHKLLGGFLAVGMAAVVMTMSAEVASAACNAFTVALSTPTVNEGSSVQITVTRGESSVPSSVRVTTIDETAKGGADYTSVDMRIAFTTEASRVFAIAIRSDGIVEGTETFRVHLSDPSGCPSDDNYYLGEDKTVTIAASGEQSAFEHATPSAPATAKSTGSAIAGVFGASRSTDKPSGANASEPSTGNASRGPHLAQRVGTTPIRSKTSRNVYLLLGVLAAGTAAILVAAYRRTTKARPDH